MRHVDAQVDGWGDLAEEFEFDLGETPDGCRASFTSVQI